MKKNIKIYNNLFEVITFKKWLDYKVFFLLISLKANDESTLIINHSEVMDLLNHKTRGSSNDCVRKIILGFRELYFENKNGKYYLIEKVEEVGSFYYIYFYNSINYLFNAPMKQYTSINLDVIISITDIHVMRFYLFLSKIIIKNEGKYKVPLICDNNYINSALWMIGDTQYYRDNPRVIRDKFNRAFKSAKKLFEDYDLTCKLNGIMEFQITYRNIKK